MLAVKNEKRNDLIEIIDLDNENGIVQFERQEMLVGSNEIAGESGSNASMQESNVDGTNDDENIAKDESEILLRLDTSNSDESNAISTPQKCQCEKRKPRPPSKQTQNKVNRERDTDNHLKCKQCEYATCYISNLKRHQRVHVREKSMGVARDSNKLFQCTHCIRKFTQLSHLSSHKKSHKDNNQYLYYCIRCMRRFVQSADKDRHERQCEGHYFECYLCKVYVATRKNHERIQVQNHSVV